MNNGIGTEAKEAKDELFYNLSSKFDMKYKLSYELSYELRSILLTEFFDDFLDDSAFNIFDGVFANSAFLSIH